MAIFLIILSCVLWIGSIAALFGYQAAAPALSFLAMLVVSFIDRDGYQALPVNNTMLISWMCMTLVVTLATAMQPEAIKRQTKGMAYMIGGGLVGLAVGLLGYSISTAATVVYAIMIVGVAAGIFFGFLVYGNTAEGQPVRPGTGNFFKYLLAKGFPTAITLMQLGTVLVLAIALNNIEAL